MEQLQPITLQPTEQRTNPLLRRVKLPGESFTLPSRGLLYDEGVLSADTQNGELHVYPMTAIDELVMKSADKLFSGDAVREVFARCIPQINDSSRLFAKDVDFLLTALFKVSYGPTISVTFTHDCDGAKEHNYEIPLDSFLRSAGQLNPLEVDSKFKYNCHGQQVVFKPATYSDIITLNQHNQMEASNAHITNEQRLANIMFALSTVIKSVDGVTDRGMIIEWLHSLPIGWLTELSNAIETTSNWGVEFMAEIKCEDCGEELLVPTNLNPVSFFI